MLMAHTQKKPPLLVVASFTCPFSSTLSSFEHPKRHEHDMTHKQAGTEKNMKKTYRVRSKENLGAMRREKAFS